MEPVTRPLVNQSITMSRGIEKADWTAWVIGRYLELEGIFSPIRMTRTVTAGRCRCSINSDMVPFPEDARVRQARTQRDLAIGMGMWNFNWWQNMKNAVKQNGKKYILFYGTSNLPVVYVHSERVKKREGRRLAIEQYQEDCKGYGLWNMRRYLPRWAV